MHWLTTVWARFRPKPAMKAQAVNPHVRPTTWDEDSDYRETINARAAERRAERARILDALIADRPGWLARRRWFR